MTTFLFYDLETTGTDPVFDQIVQFAAIRTDEALNAIGEPVNRFVRLRPDVIPSPEALLKTHRSVASLQHGENEYEVMCDIWKLVNEPGTISIGYNSLSFDDVFLRFGFYRNLLPAYTHQYANYCGRADLLAAVIRYRHFAPDALIWPELPDGPTLKLEHLAAANRCEDGQAHDALADVRAVVNLARHLAACPDQWQNALLSFNKQRDQALANALPRWPSPGAPYRLGTLLAKELGKKTLYSAPALYVGNSKRYGNLTYWLRLDSEQLWDKACAGEPPERYWKRKNWVEPPQIAGLQQLAMSDEQLSWREYNLGWLSENGVYLQQLRDYAFQYTYPVVENVDIDAALYLRSFPDQTALAAHARFRDAPLAVKKTLATALVDSGDRKLAYRLLWRNYGCCEGETACLDPLMQASGCKDYKGRWKRARADALAEVRELEADFSWDDEQYWSLQEIRSWLQGEEGEL